MWILAFILAFTASASEVAPISRAQKLALKKDRQGACAELVTAIRRTTNTTMRSRMVDSLAMISKMFFTDKGQKLYESGQSSMYENPSVAMTQFEASLKLEDQNILILENMARIELERGSCEAAAGDIGAARNVNPYSTAAALLELQTLLCSHSYSEFHKSLKALPAVKKNQQPFLDYAWAEDFAHQNQPRRALEELTKVSKEIPKFPEVYYRLWKQGGDLGRDVDAAAEKYVSLCKSLTIRQRKRFDLEPRLCLKVKEVQNELAKKNGDL